MHDRGAMRRAESTASVRETRSHRYTPLIVLALYRARAGLADATLLGGLGGLGHTRLFGTVRRKQLSYEPPNRTAAEVQRSAALPRSPYAPR